jgi:hypothetical protein
MTRTLSPGASVYSLSVATDVAAGVADAACGEDEAAHADGINSDNIMIDVTNDLDTFFRPPKTYGSELIAVVTFRQRRRQGIV